MVPRSATAVVSIDAPSVDGDPVQQTCAIAPYLMTRRPGTRLLAGVFLIAAAPLIVGLGLMIRLTSRGPVLFRQVRLGVDGRPFTMLKLRTMIDGAEKLRPGDWTRVEDTRITRLGRHLRRWHLDELPQLVNVVRGEMALVGPRPERPDIAARLAEQIAGYAQRQRVLPGIVGLAQINLPPDTGVDCVRRKLHLDVEYMRTASFGLDLRMIAWSAARLIGVPFDLATGALGLLRDIPIPDAANEGTAGESSAA